MEIELLTRIGVITSITLSGVVVIIIIISRLLSKLDKLIDKLIIVIKLIKDHHQTTK